MQCELVGDAPRFVVGVLCATCSPGYGVADTECAKCESATMSWLLLMILVLVVFIGVCYAVLRVIRIKQGAGGFERRETFATLKVDLVLWGSLHYAWLTPLAHVFAATGAVQLHSSDWLLGGVRHGLARHLEVHVCQRQLWAWVRVQLFLHQLCSRMACVRSWAIQCCGGLR